MTDDRMNNQQFKDQHTDPSGVRETDAPHQDHSSVHGPDAPHKDHTSVHAANVPHLDPLAAAKMLDNIFEEAEVEPNTVPMEALTAYSESHKDRFLVHKILIIAMLVVLLIIPALFISPKYHVELGETSENGLPVYSINVDSVLPVNEVRAEMEGRNLAVYEKNSRTFLVEAPENGTMEVSVRLFNKQQVIKKVNVTAVDEAGPVLVSCETENDSVCLKIDDKGVGVDYEAAYALTNSGEVIMPSEIDEAEGIIRFPFPEERVDVFIPDLRDNTLHLSLKLK